ncbi:UDP-glycosyltransferase-01 [Ephemera danica]|nr:UDP-glycosyltransferase-01 [Ephemera danica]
MIQSVAVLVVLGCMVSVRGSNILMVTMCGTRSHTVPFVALSRELSSAHNVTFLSGFPGSAAEGLAEEISPVNMVQYIRKYHEKIDFIGHRYFGTHAIPPPELLRYGIEICKTLLEDQEFLSFIHDQSRHYEVVLIDSTYSACALALAHRFHAPYIFVNPVGFNSMPLSDNGNLVPYATTPFMFTGFSEQMHLAQRGWNAFCHLVEWFGNYILAEWYLQPMLQEVYGDDLPRIWEMQKNASFILHNAHPVLMYPRALLPNVAEIGCIHCHEAEPLPEDLERWVQGSGSRGVILVSMGSITTEGHMPEAVRLMLTRALAKIPQRVIWKWTGNASTAFPEKPPANVKIVSWMPQQDLLGHPKVLGMVSHGGLLSMYEAAYHGKPSVMMPVYFDHDSNALKAETDGYAVRLELRGLTSDALAQAITELVQNPRYRASAERKARLLRDQPETALQRSVFWVEHVLRHKGAAHLQGGTRNMSLFQILYLDLLVVTLLVIVVIHKLPVICDSLRVLTDKVSAVSVNKNLMADMRFNAPAAETLARKPR